MAPFWSPNVERLKARRDVPGLIQALGYTRSERVRQDAVTALAELGASVAPSLVPLLETHDVSGAGAIQTLIRIGVPAGPTLIQALDDPRVGMRRRASYGLGEIICATKDAGLYHAAAAPLMARFEDSDPLVRQSAVNALNARVKGAADQDLQARLVPKLIERLRDTSGDVRLCASYGLAQIADPRGVESLILGLHDQDHRVRRNCADGLGRMRDVQAVQPLVAALVDPDESVRNSARDALAALGGLPSQEALSALLIDRDLDFRRRVVSLLEQGHWNPDKSEAGAWYWITKGELSRCTAIGSPAVGPLIRALEDPVGVVGAYRVGRFGQLTVEQVAKTLGEIGDKRAVEPLLARLSDGSTNLSNKSAMIYALGQLRDERAVEPLLARLSDRSTDLVDNKNTVICALGDLHDERAVEPLLAILKGGNWCAADALLEIGGGALVPLVTVLVDLVKKDDQRSWNYVVAAAEKVAKIRDRRAAEPLSILLSRSNNRLNGLQKVTVTKALRVLGFEGAFEPLVASLEDEEESARYAAANALDSMGWQPADDRTRVAYLAARDYEVKVIIPPLSAEGLAILWDKLEVFIVHASDPKSAHCRRIKNILRIIEQSGSPSSRRRFIDLVFKYPQKLMQLEIPIPFWFGFYTPRLEAIVSVFRPTSVEGSSLWRDNDGYDYRFPYSTTPLDKVMEFLCASDNPVATNLLHKMASFPTVLVDDGASDRGQYGSHELGGVVKARQRATEELLRRLHPPYDPAAYEVDEHFH
jgi:HEAT repeat protein